jgi:hypothetical protein
MVYGTGIRYLLCDQVRIYIAGPDPDEDDRVDAELLIEAAPCLSPS